MLNFALDGDYDKEPMIRILKKTYEIERFPTIVIDDEKFEGLTDKDIVLAEICKRYDPMLPDCLASQPANNTIVIS